LKKTGKRIKKTKNRRSRRSRKEIKSKRNRKNKRKKTDIALKPIEFNFYIEPILHYFDKF
jgi:hypothetical protein